MRATIGKRIGAPKMQNGADEGDFGIEGGENGALQWILLGRSTRATQKKGAIQGTGVFPQLWGPIPGRGNWPRNPGKLGFGGRFNCALGRRLGAPEKGKKAD